MNKITHIILCIIDNVRSDHLFNFVNRGLLPNIKKLMDNGIYSKNCITDFPPITYPTQVSMITGTYTGDYQKELCHGVPLVNWMGRDKSPPILRNYTSRDLQIYKLNNDIGNRCKTILEMVENGNTSSITQFISRGADYFYPERKSKLAMYYLFLKLSRNVKRMITRANSIIAQKILENFKNPKKFFQNNEPPICSLLWFMTSDLLLHLYGFDSEIYKLNLLHIDKVIGLLIDNLDEMGYLDETAIVITSDHGNYKASRVGYIKDFLERYKLTSYYRRKNLRGNINIAKYDGIGFFNFKGINKSDTKYSWVRPELSQLKKYGPKKLNLLKELFKIEGSHLMYYRDDDNTYNKGIIHLKRKSRNHGNKIILSTIEYRGNGLDYKTKYISDDNENDVFNYLNDHIASQLLDNRFHSIDEWLSATYHLDYPMHPDLIPRHFKNPRSCDIILSNDGKVVFNINHGKQYSKNLYNHDLGLRSCMNVPLIIGGSSEIAHKEMTCCKTTDIVPTMLKIIGKKPHKSVIGTSLI